MMLEISDYFLQLAQDALAVNNSFTMISTTALHMEIPRKEAFTMTQVRNEANVYWVVWTWKKAIWVN